MSNSSKKLVTFVAMSLLFTSTAFAAEETKNGVGDFFRKLFHVPAKTTEETAKTIGNTLQNTGEKVVAATGENTSQILQGDLGKTGELVADPVVGTAQTAGQTVADTATIPDKVWSSMPGSDDSEKK